MDRTGPVLRGTLVAAALVAAFVAARCTTSTITTVEPSPLKCVVALNPESASINPSSTVVSFAVSADTDCDWSPTTAASWISNIAPAVGQGSGQVQFRAAANTGPARTGTLVVADTTFSVNQAGGCTYAIKPTIQQMGSAGGSGAVAVAAGAGCTWSAASNAAWISLPPGVSGTGNGSVAFDVQANTGPERTGTLTIAGQVFTLTQASGCTYSIAPTSRAFDGSGGTDAVTVTAPAGCTWTAQVSAAALGWMAILSGAQGTGNGTVEYIVAPLFFGARNGTIAIAGQTFTVSQKS